MKKFGLLFSLIVSTVFFLSSCSKCYDCTQTIYIYDSNGNVIDEQEAHDELCTADSKMIDDKESSGWDCR